MDVYTASTSIQAPPDHVFDYMADPANQPNWAINFVRATRTADDGWWVMDTPVGEITYRVDVEPTRRVADWVMKTPAGEVVMPARVVPLAGGSLVTFTIIRGPGQPDEAWEQGRRGMDEEISVLRDILEGRR